MEISERFEIGFYVKLLFSIFFFFFPFLESITNCQIGRDFETACASESNEGCNCRHANYFTVLFLFPGLLLLLFFFISAWQEEGYWRIADCKIFSADDEGAARKLRALSNFADL